jgi:predicted nucleic acid-binding protein
VTICFDTSAMAKLLIGEEGSAYVGQLWARAPDPYASIVGYAALRGSIARGHRAGRIAAVDYPMARAELERLWQTVVEVALSARMARFAGALAEKHGLGALDSIHLASALSIATPEDRPTLVTFDRRLAEAALAEGLTVLPEVG